MDRTHINERTSAYTHAGGVVYRATADEPVYLLVTAKNNDREWVLPKGHIHPGETLAAAAVREVREEAGIESDVVEELGAVRFSVGQEDVRALFFLLKAKGTSKPSENRAVRWCSIGEALSLATFDDSREALRNAHTLLTKQPR